MSPPELQPCTTLVGAMGRPQPDKEEKGHALRPMGHPGPIFQDYEHQMKLGRSAFNHTESQPDFRLRRHIKACGLRGRSALNFGGLLVRPAVPRKGLWKPVTSAG